VGINGDRNTKEGGAKKKVFWSAHPLHFAHGAIDCPQLADQSSSHSRTYGNKVEIRNQLLNLEKKKKKKKRRKVSL
jgi:hypothetical protein